MLRIRWDRFTFGEPILVIILILALARPAAAQVPDDITFLGGQQVASFTINTDPMDILTAGKITATLGDSSLSKTLKVQPIAVARVTLTPSPVVGPAVVNGTATLECPAAPGDIEVLLSRSKSEVASVDVERIVIPWGQTTGAFTVSAKDVDIKSSTVIRARTQNTTIPRSKRLVVWPGCGGARGGAVYSIQTACLPTRRSIMPRRESEGSTRRLETTLRTAGPKGTCR